MKYQIEFTKEQLLVVQEACEFMSRFCCGQLDMLPQSFLNYLHNKNKDIDEYYDKRNRWEYGLKITKQAMFPELPANGSYGIRSKYKEANICYDIYRPILEQFTKEYQMANPNENNYSVYASPGPAVSKEGRINIKTIYNE